MANTVVRNNHPGKHFGVDVFIDLFPHEDEHHVYFDCPTDYKKPDKNKKPRTVDVYDELNHFVSHQDEPMLYGVFKNPDPFEQDDFELKRVLDILRPGGNGLLIESSSRNILASMDMLVDFASKNTLVIVFPIGLINHHLLEVFGFTGNAFQDAKRVFPSLNKHQFHFGAAIKPVLPYINDRIEHYEKIIGLCEKHGADFVYPTFRIHQNRRQHRAYMTLIKEYMPQLSNIYMDRYGEKRTLASEYRSDLKRDVVFSAHKAKLAYGMKDIISSYKDKQESSQLSIFD
jgi:DNA repair photolyase